MVEERAGSTRKVVGWLPAQPRVALVGRVVASASGATTKRCSGCLSALLT